MSFDARWRTLGKGLSLNHGFPDARGLAAALLDATGQRARPVDLQKILEHWPGLRVSMDELDGAGYLVDLSSTDGEIILRQQDSYPRRRFTLSHELGHWLLGQGIDQSHGKPSGSNNPSNPAGAVERWCDTFAVELLLPKEWILGELDHLTGHPLASRVAQFPHLYGTSKTATWLRISELTDISIFLREPKATGTLSGLYISQKVESAAERLELVRAVKQLDNFGSTRGRTLVSTSGHLISCQRVGVKGQTLCVARPT